MKKATIVDLASFLERIFDLDKHDSNTRCYRGQSDATWPLKPSIMRGLRPDAENSIFSELLLEAPTEFSSDRSMFEKLVRAQHYGLPTRLLDVSLNPLVGLYFACAEKKYWNCDGTVQVFDFTDKRVKNADSDTVSLICNLARLSDAERQLIDTKLGRNQSWTATEKESFRSIAPMKRLNQFVRVEKPYFLDIAEPRDLLRYFFVHPSKNNRRVIAQSGAFIAAGLLQYRSPAKSSGFDIIDLAIPAARKETLLDQLDAININSRAMFPEVDSTAKYIREKWVN
ncbi:FRG domain-containing protein [Agrobacterium sp. SOY23]|uniref:FRG domain-containing protein n=1 Tax=Agrobacterium sp. SOY23 TaxID=3014555 RepID=UPI0022AFEA7A|nr:FRG domain-containing protein [Agrobacterium sp. SOY23]MCZ4433171.1 FRG domain-containing protein [Agrobacterium sp. SOY23]